jgi:alkaline phosphatase D
MATQQPTEPGPHGDPAAFEPDPVFPWAVASFEPTATGVLLWTRVTQGGTVGWEVATDPDFTDVVASGTVEAATPEVLEPADPGARSGEPEPGDREPGEPEPGTSRDREPDPASVVGRCGVEVDGLAPATDHHYRFTLGDDVSPVGRTRTLPDDDQPVRLGLACCGDHSAGYFSAYRALAEADIDVVVHLGDYVYADPGGTVRATDPPHDAVTRADYRRRYAQTRRDPDLLALHLRHPVIAVIDDHDLADNAARTGAKGHDSDTQGPWADRAAATAERAEWLPVRTDGPPAGRPRRHAAVRPVGLGSWCCRHPPGRPRSARRTDDPPLDDPASHHVGGHPGRLGRGDHRHPPPWVLLVSSVVFNEMRVPVPGRVGLNRPFPAGYLIDDGTALNSDGWDGYPAERARLVRAMRERGRGVVVLSGDVHSSWAFEGPADDTGPVAVELTCPAVTSAPMGEMLPVGADLADRLVAHQEGIRWADLFGRGHVVVEVGPRTVTGSWWFTDPEVADATPVAASSWVHQLDRPPRPPDPLGGDDGPADRASPDAAADALADADAADVGGSSEGRSGRAAAGAAPPGRGGSPGGPEPPSRLARHTVAGGRRRGGGRWGPGVGGVPSAAGSVAPAIPPVRPGGCAGPLGAAGLVPAGQAQDCSLRPHGP